MAPRSSAPRLALAPPVDRARVALGAAEKDGAARDTGRRWQQRQDRIPGRTSTQRSDDRVPLVDGDRDNSGSVE